MAKKKKKNYSDEIMRIKRLKVVTDVLEKGDVENAFLTTAAKDSDTGSDTTVERMLEELDIEKGSNKEMNMLDNLLASKKEDTRRKRPKPPAKKKRR